MEPMCVAEPRRARCLLLPAAGAEKIEVFDVFPAREARSPHARSALFARAKRAAMCGPREPLQPGSYKAILGLLGGSAPS